MSSRSARFVLVAVLILAASWPLLFGRRVAFRDVNHFYLPLYDYVAQRSAREWLPLWNPLDQTGMPLIGETSTAVLYPIRFAVYSLPITSEVAMNVYLIVHLLIASMAAAWLAARIGSNTLGIMTAAILYPLSGSVYSLCCNPPFLVGAAWIPFVLGACLTSHPNSSKSDSLSRRVLIASIGFSLMILGGDPQSALHCGLIVVGFAVFHGFALFRDVNLRSVPWLARPCVRPLVVCCLASVVAIALTSIQIAASVDWSRQSNRVGVDQERDEIYEFSLAPWHLLECVTARPFGQLFPINQRVARLIPGEGRMWTPSIYAGLVVGFALLLRLLQPRRYFSDPWFAVAMVSLLFCFGHFGLVWLLQQIPGVFPRTHSAVGGPYWILCQIIPGYQSFRYPVKWLPIFAIASTMVAARWISEKPWRKERSIACALLGLFLFGAIASHWASQCSEQLFAPALSQELTDEYWGPLDLAGGFGLIRTSCLCSILILLAMLWLRASNSDRQDRVTNHWIMGAWLLLMFVDGLSNVSSLLPTVDIRRERSLAHQASPSPLAFTRTLRTQAGQWPDRWRETVSANRALEVAASERIAWFGRWHLAERQAVFNSMVSIQSDQYSQFWESSQSYVAGLDPQSRRQFWRSTARWLAIGATSHVDQTKSIAAEGLALVHVRRERNGPVEDVRLFTAWMPEQSMPEIVRSLGASDRLPLPRVGITAPKQAMGGAAINSSKSVSEPLLVRQDDDRMAVKCDNECLLERCVLQDGHWTAKLDSRTGDQSRWVPVLASSHLNQAILIPSGDWIVSFHYHPWWLFPAVVTTGIGVFFLLVLMFLANQASRRLVRGIVFFSFPGRLLRNESLLNSRHFTTPRKAQ